MQAAIEISLAARCLRCTSMTPVEGLREQVPCRTCATHIDVAASIAESFPGGIGYLFDDQHALLSALIADEGAELQRSSSSSRAVLTMRTVALACSDCHAALEAPAATQTEVACTCGARIPVRWPDASTAGWDLRISYVLGETPVRSAPTTISGIVVPCGGCGAPLTRIGTDRTAVCEHCATSNVLPEDVWLRLTSDSAPRPFVLVYQVDGATLARLLARIDVDEPPWRNEPKKSRIAALVRRAR